MGKIEIALGRAERVQLGAIRSNHRPLKFKPRMEEYFARTPGDCGVGGSVWSIKVLIAHYEKETGGEHKRGQCGAGIEGGQLCLQAGQADNSSTPPPSREEKLAKVQAVASEIMALKKDGNVGIMFGDESHFSIEPYVARG